MERPHRQQSDRLAERHLAGLSRSGRFGRATLGCLFLPGGLRKFDRGIATDQVSRTILSHHQASTLLEARRAGRSTAITSLDLGLTNTEVTLTPTG